MKLKTINGFSPEEIFQLYAFLESYETAGVKNFQTQRALFREHPELTDLTVVIAKVKCHISSSAQMMQIDIKSLKNEIYFTEYQSGNILSLLYHVRNSIAHACAVKHGDSVLITDYKVSRPIDFSARGRIDLEIINEFTNILNKIGI